ncbi:hypothetical protein H0484_04540 [Pusillimonas sp. CC-YST705]|uniref:RNA polymerase sigma factor n=1 Tax=Mesopusillimonas faecipullorum TaxID=2755040 RepID=A0ABS8CAG0_9BURK|nr:sigma factor [Mesopusillimonas faecipullorum]MCB5363022.1 hypothetical protein [Mesopusillimonas faecipullorum]
MSHAHAFDHHSYILACAQGRAQALHALFNHEAPSMLALAQVWLGDEARARQVLSDTFILVWRHASHYPAQAEQARAWLYSILRHRLKYEAREGQVPDRARWHNLPQLSAHVLAALPDADKRLLQAAYSLGLNRQSLTLLAPHADLNELRPTLAALVHDHGLESPTLPALDQEALAAYVLGVADEVTDRRATDLLQSQAAAAQHVLHWEGVCLVFVDALPPATASQELLIAICRQLKLPLPVPMPVRASVVQTRAQASQAKAPAAQAAARPAAYPQSETPKPLLRVPSGNTAERAKVEGAVPAQAQPQAPQPGATTPPAAVKTPEIKPAPAPAPKSVAAEKPAAVTPTAATPAPETQPTDTPPSATTPAPIHAERRSAQPKPERSRPRPSFLPWLGGLAMMLALGVAGYQWLSGLSQAAVPPPPPTLQHLAVLQAPGSSSTPGWLLTQTSDLQLNLRPLVNVELAPNEAVYLWTQAQADPSPRLLSRVVPNMPLRLAPELIGPVQAGQVFEMTLEPMRQTLPAEPEGPVLFIGRTVGLESAAPPATPGGAAHPPALRNP